MLSSVRLSLVGQVGMVEAVLLEILETPLKYICHLLVQLFLKPTVAVVEDWAVMEQLLEAAEVEEQHRLASLAPLPVAKVAIHPLAAWLVLIR